MKWSGKHVPNSPFNVQIFKTKEEFDKFLAEHPKESFRLDEATAALRTTASSAATTELSSKEILVQRI